MDIPSSVTEFIGDQLAGLVVEQVIPEPESAAYSACRLILDGQLVLFRVAKRTPKKVGHFVTLWKRPKPNDEIAPFDIQDGVAAVMIAVEHENERGVFIFDSEVLEAKGIFSDGSKEGKRGFRVYAPTTSPTSATAQRTQKWQTAFFVADGVVRSPLANCLRTAKASGGHR